MAQQQNNHGAGNVHLSHSSSPQPQNHEEDLSPTNLGLGIANTNPTEYPFGTNQYIQANNNNLLFNANQGQTAHFTQAELNNALYASSQGQDFQPSFQQQLNSNNDQFFATDFLSTNNFGQPDFNSLGNNSHLDPNMNANMNMNTNMNQNFNQNMMPNMNQNMNQQSMHPNMNEQFDSSMFLNEVPTQNAGQSINPADLGLVSQSSPNYQSPSPPPMFQGPGSQVSSAQHSPAIPQQSQFGPSRGHSRNASLQPETAHFPNAQMPTDWTQYRGSHRRTPSESNYSDISASSAAPSPNLGSHDTFDDHRTSPMLHAQQDPQVFQDLRGLGQFSISDPQLQATSPFHGRSPAHSPIPSPRLNPQNPQQMPLPELNQHSPFSLAMGMPPQPVTHHSAPDVFQQGMGSIKFERNDSTEMGQAQQMPPPDINIEFAPASRQNSFEPPKPMALDQDALTPPQRGRRPRASSDVTFSRQSTPGLSPGMSTARGSSQHSARSLSPMDRLGGPGHRRRHSTSNTPSAPTGQRDYILSLADPEHQPVGGQGDNGKPRVQKHPATFQCTLCPKRFTRAYNLRSHLRTHTDERPFVCTVCGKAFARQHDRKRHEGLHSGEKKFVCKGDLKQGGHWGCSRRFARADALGRHFRSEAGRICIKPLLDEEQLDRQRQWQEQHFAQNNMQAMPMQQPGFGVDLQGNYALPARLIEQYPALANLTWSDMPPQGQGYDDDISGRSSFDASGSEYFDDDEGGYVSGPGLGLGPGPQMNEHGFPGGYVSDYGGR